MYIIISFVSYFCRLPGPDLQTALFMSASIQGESTFLITGGYKMSIEGNTEGERSADILKYNGINKVWKTDDSEINQMELARGGHATIPITYSKQLEYLMSNHF